MESAELVIPKVAPSRPASYRDRWCPGAVRARDAGFQPPGSIRPERAVTACFPQSPGALVSALDHLYPELLADTMMAGQAEQRPSQLDHRVPCCVGEGAEQVSCRVGWALSRHTQGQVMTPLKSSP